MSLQTAKDVIDDKIIKSMHTQSRKIRDSWLEALRNVWAEHADSKLRLLEKDIKQKRDPFSLLLQMSPEKVAEVEPDVDPFLYRVRKTDYSILDFSHELSNLERSIENSLQASPDISARDILTGMRSIKNCLSKVLQAVLKHTSEVYERINESNGRAFCQIDVGGKIVYANMEMERIVNRKSLVGSRFESFFAGEEQKFVRMAISGEFGDEAVLRKLLLRLPKEKPITVGAEIAPVYINGEHRGAYAGMVNLSLQEDANIEIFDRSPFGIVKVDTQGRFTYANPVALDAYGIDRWENMDISAIGLNYRDYKKMEKELKGRSEGKSGDYSVHITRLNDGKRVPVKISAIPETDLKGKIVGSTALVQSLLNEEVINGIHAHVATIRDGKKILQKVAMEVEKLIPFSQFFVLVYNSKMTHVRELFPGNQDDPLLSQILWWKIPRNMKDWMSNRNAMNVPDIMEFLSEPSRKKLKKQPEIKNIINKGFKSYLRFPIIKGGRIAATLTLFEKKKNAFNEKHIETLKMLPLIKAVLMALYYEEIKEFKFRLDLIREISSASNDIGKAAKAIVTRVARHYRWQHVALFSVDENEGVFSLLRQKGSSKEFRLPKNFTQPLSKGIFNYVYEHNKPVNIGNVRKHKKFRKIFKPSLKKTLSELCLPIKTNEFFWLLNIEDQRENAFSKEEQRSLVGIVRELKKFLEKCWLYNFLQASLDFASDALIITDSKNYIKKTNETAQKLLGSEGDNLVGKPFGTYFKDSQQAHDLLHLEKKPSDEVIFCRADEKEVSAILSRSQIKENISDKVYFATDLSLQKRVLELENYWKMYNEIATQTKTPLSLAFGWLSQLKEEAEERTFPGFEYLDKSLRQLRKVELSYDRLALYDKKNEIKPHAVQFDLLQLLLNVKEEFPESEKTEINITHDKTEYDALGDIFQISFSIKTILSYLLRFIPQKEKISISLRENEGFMAIDISVNFPGFAERSDADIVHARRMSELEKEMALGNELIKTFINENNGSFESNWVGERVSFMIKLYK